MKIIDVNEIALTYSEIGGKAKGLISLVKNNLKVPEFYLIANDTVSLIENSEKEIQQLLVNWRQSYQIDETQLWAVRSSAGIEDGKEKSFAGQFKTMINVNYNDLSKAIQAVLNSYKLNTEYAEIAISNAVIIQKMLSPDYSGVLFTKDPLKPYSDQPIINIIPGLGEKLVSGEFSGQRIEFDNLKPKKIISTDNVEGEIFKNGILRKVNCSNIEIENAISPHLNTVLEAASKLEKINNAPLDIEFAIQDGEFFWLQVRPITTRKLNHEFMVWDNTSVEANYPGTTLPLSISFVQKTFFKAYTGAGKAIGFNKRVLEANNHLLKQMCGEIDGALYYNITAWQSLIFLMPFGKTFSGKLPKLWGMEKTTFVPPLKSHSKVDKIRILFYLIGKIIFSAKLDRQYNRIHNNTIESFNKTNLKTYNFNELINKYQAIESRLGDNWIAPALNGFYTMISFTLLKRKVERSKIFKTHPNFVNDILFSEGDVISVKLVRDFQLILTEISENNSLKSLFETYSDSEVLELLPLNFTSFNDKLENYIEIYGNRTDQGELKMETITYKQNPSLFIHYIKSNLKGFKPRPNNDSKFNYKKIIRQHYPINFIQRWLFNKLIKSTVKRITTRENYRFMRTDTFAMIRSIFIKMGSALKKEDQIEQSEDVFFIKLNEILDIKNQINLKATVQKRKEEHTKSENNSRLSRYIQCERKFIPIAEDEDTISDNQLKGTGCCTGEVKGEVLFIDEHTDLNQDFSNYILMAKYFEPGWISLFYQAKGTISERGNLLSHTAIICRELNVPTIVGVKGLTKKIKNHDLIIMDGATGIIKLMEHE